VTSDFTPEVEIWPSCMRNAFGDNYRTISFIVDEAGADTTFHTMHF